ncbi:heterokaryon incompatibility protein-domain-containing protein [Immersiella caudata]|uniref:Heterokaryon incompatibility protein-domain-containing protein n=1 Tax=Immersiella caudata TaxID=314043 RepID=A0AA39WZ18_9PEZI|nr:heterokaryon incompatibility protein-domain-containing protein [Immersiella caudata]
MAESNPSVADCNICRSGFFGDFEIKNDIEARKLTPDLSLALFHGDCDRCNRELLSDTALCAFCQHLRLRHLLLCVDFEQPPFKNIQIKFCDFEDAVKRVTVDGCTFCRLAVRSALPYRYFSGVAGPNEFDSATLALRFSQAGIQPTLYFPEALARVGSWEMGRNIRYRQAKPAGGSTTDRDSEDVELIESHVDWNMASRWLSQCCERHENCAATQISMLPDSFRVIDIRRRCLVHLPPGSGFIALSYVWGRNPDPTKLFAIKSNIEKLQTEDGLPKPLMPATVEDAIEACRRIGEDYLWVDRLCIIQDDPQDKQDQIGAMAAIYWLAKVAIIVTDGDSDSGIAGVSRERNQLQSCADVLGLELVNEAVNWRRIVSSSCVWSTRGWTYQEAILSWRKLYLTGSQTVFECRDHILSEDGSTEHAEFSLHGLRPQPYMSTVDLFYKHLRSYRTRSLTNQSDIYNAIDGVASALYSGSGSLWNGLPFQEFDEALLWHLDQPLGGPTGLIGNETTPSWSWSSTNKGVGLLNSYNAFQVSYCDTIVAWARFVGCNSEAGSTAVESIRRTEGARPLSLFHEDEDDCYCTDSQSSTPEELEEKLLCVVIAWSEGCIQTPYPFEHPCNTTFADLRLEIMLRWECHHDYWFEALRDTMITDGEQHPTISYDSAAFASAQCAFFRLQGSGLQDGSGSFGNLCIIDKSGQPAGLLLVQDPQLGHALLDTVGKKFEFVALSISTSCDVVLSDGSLRDVALIEFRPRPEDSSPSVKGLTFWDRNGDYLFPLPVVNVMMIQRVGEMLAKRITIGWIYLTSWSKAERQFNTVYLQ